MKGNLSNLTGRTPRPDFTPAAEGVGTPSASLSMEERVARLEKALGLEALETEGFYDRQKYEAAVLALSRGDSEPLNQYMLAGGIVPVRDNYRTERRKGRRSEAA